jgi:predicted lactoylglutathione lyase
VSIASTCRISGGITWRSTRRGHPADRDRRRSFEFYQQVLGVDAVGEQADDGVPEPLQFPLNDGVRLMLIPRGGFGWVVQPRTVAEEGHRECLVTVFADDDTGVDAFVRWAADAGGTIVSPPGAQAWAYKATFTDPDGRLWSVMRR